MKKNSLNVVISVLSVACVVMAVALIGVIGIALVSSGGDKPDKQTDVNSAVLSTDEANEENATPSTDEEEENNETEAASETTEATTEATTEKVTEETTEKKTDEDGLIIVNPEQKNWNLVVVNSGRAMPEGFVPELKTVAGTDVRLDYRVAPHYDEMYNAAKKDGIYLTPYSGYRSYERQKINYNNLTEKYMGQYGLSRAEAAKKAATVILPPGTSEHNLGLAMDICNTYDSFANQKEYKWLTENAHKYGFILRYTADKMDITGIVSEPWHWRYVGVEHAGKIKDSGLCLEEYLDSIGVAY